MASAPLKETDSKQPLLLGVDGGGTSCRARIADLDGTILGEGFAGSANPRTGLDSACNAIMQATRAAMDKAGLGGKRLWTHVCRSGSGRCQSEERT